MSPQTGGSGNSFFDLTTVNEFVPTLNDGGVGYSWFVLETVTEYVPPTEVPPEIPAGGAGGGGGFTHGGGVPLVGKRIQTRFAGKVGVASKPVRIVVAGRVKQTGRPLEIRLAGRVNAFRGMRVQFAGQRPRGNAWLHAIEQDDLELASLM